jgi:pyruvate, water dikinase
VSGEVTPDKYVVSKVTSDIADRAVSQKAREHVPDPKGGVIERDVDADRQSQPCLSDEEITALATLAKKVERHYGRPQDIEWAISRDGELFLLQSRPETVWAKKDGAPVAAVKASGMEHVFSVLGGRRS